VKESRFGRDNGIEAIFKNTLVKAVYQQFDLEKALSGMKIQ